MCVECLLGLECLLRHVPLGCTGISRALAEAALANSEPCVRALLEAGADAGFEDDAALRAAVRADASPNVRLGWCMRRIEAQVTAGNPRKWQLGSVHHRP
jgi:hypothetical protein